VHFLRLFEDIALLICHTTRLARYGVSITQSHHIWAVMNELSLWCAWEYISLLHQKNEVNWLQNMSCRLDFPFLTLHNIFFWLFFSLIPYGLNLAFISSLLEDGILKCITLSFFLLGSRARFLFFWLFASLSPFIT